MNETPVEGRKGDQLSRVMFALVLIWIGGILLLGNSGWLANLTANLSLSGWLGERLANSWSLALGGAGLIFLAGGIVQAIRHTNRRQKIWLFIMAVVSLNAGGWIPVRNGLWIPLILILIGVYIIARGVKPRAG